MRERSPIPFQDLATVYNPTSRSATSWGLFYDTNNTLKVGGMGYGGNSVLGLSGAQYIIDQFTRPYVIELVSSDSRNPVTAHRTG
jgi:hypothetical protein